ncbi:MCE family protein [Corallincola luteus]|uniref:MCE family protein n=1 Tax=Corallincola luteus TaxID=1775177 RepID=A0ABY2ARU0_9GAMM|nr:MlaD family protein [Corallincola luteus]TCI04812.1 MCE family protein [Corallincola luteus]
MSDVESNNDQSNSDDIAEALVEKRKGIPMVWLLPLLALAIGGWLVYKSITEAKLPVNIAFDTGEGIVKGKTEVRYKGFTIGVVDDLIMNKTLDGVTAVVLFERDAERALREGTQFWLVKPEVTLAGVSGLDTLLSGNYIAVDLGDSNGKPAKDFVALPKAPPMDDNTPGLHITLYSETLDSLAIGSPLLYRQLQVGSVTDYKLEEDGSKVSVKVHVEPEYEKLVTKKTRFWNISGVDIQGGLDGFSVDVGSLATIVAGGIAFGDASGSGDASAAEDGDIFSLFKNFSEAETGISVKVHFEDASGIIEDKTKVKFKGHNIGIVEDLQFNEDLRGATAVLNLDPMAERALMSDTRFWVVRPTLTAGAVEGMDALLSGPYISVAPALTGEATREFVGLDDAPPISWDVPGLHLILNSPSAASLERGNPIFYKRVEVGTVQSVDLQDDGKQVNVTIYIHENYQHLVNDKTRFWHAGGVDIEGKLSGIKIRTYSLVSMLSGGLAFDTPPTKEAPKAVRNGHEFSLFESYGDAHADRIDSQIDTSAPGRYLVVETPEPGGLQIGAPVDYLNLTVGEVIGLELNDANDGVRVHLRIEPRFAHLVREGSHFWRSGGIDVSGDLNGITLRTPSLAALVLGGVSFDTPKEHLQSALAKNGATYLLADSYKAAHEKGLEISIKFADGVGLKAGSELKLEGMVIGRVKKVTLDDSLSGINAVVLVEKYAEQIARHGSQFWIVQPHLGLVETSNLDTLISGVYVQTIPGDGEQRLSFEGLQRAPQRTLTAEGLNVVIKTPRLNSMKRGDPVLYRQVEVGEVMGYELADTADHVRVFVNIRPRYQALVRDNSVFWSASGINVDAGIFSGVKIQTESLESILAGGIAFATPEQPGKQAADGDSFMLRAEADEAWLKWAPTIALDR